MPYETVLIADQDRVRTISLNRPEKLNAMTSQLAEEMIAAIEDADKDDAVNVIVLTGAGRGFCAGLDLTQERDNGREPTRWQRMDDLGWVGRQALVITGMDAVGHAATVTELVRLAKFNADGTRLNLETNPYAVQAAERVVLEWMKEGRARPAVVDYLNYLQQIERAAFGASRRQQLIHEARMRRAGVK